MISVRRRQYGRVNDEIKLPVGYTRCDYVKATANTSCVITTGITQVGNWSVEMVITDAPTTGTEQYVIYTDNWGNFHVGLQRNLRLGINANDEYVTLEQGQRVTFDCGFDHYGGFLNINGQHIEGTGTTYKNAKVKIFGATYGANTVLVQAGICWIKCTEGGKFFGVAAKRDSDGIYGLYDIENDVFYGNEYYTGLELT